MTITAAIARAAELMTGDLDLTADRLAAAVRKLEIAEIAQDQLVGQQRNKIPEGRNVVGFLRTLDVSAVQSSYETKLEGAFAEHKLALHQIGRSTRKSTTFAVIAI
jgi:hypothetical protein